MLACAAAAPAMAQQAPDAGTLLRQQPRPAPPPAPSDQPFAVETPAAPTGGAGVSVLVKTIHITGATLIPADELVAQLRPLIGKEHTLADLHRAAVTLIGYYAQKGYIARVVLPPQEIRDGVVEYRVVEGARAEVKVAKAGKRVDADRVQRFIDARLPKGGPMDLRALGDAVNILNQQPGVSATAVLSSGKAERDVDIGVVAQDRPLLSYSLGVNNQGSLGTGVVQGMAGLTVANPTGRFDQVSVLANGSEGSVFGRAEYSLAVGDRGLRLGVDASGLGYKLVQPRLAPLHASGSGVTGGLIASYPFAARTAFSLAATSSFDVQHYVDRTAAGETSNRTAEVASLGVSGQRLQRSGPFAGYQTFGATVVAGNSDQHNAAARAADEASLRAGGGFAKLAWTLGWARPLMGGWIFSGAARGQFAAKNLDSSQKMSLGGPTGVRGYPVAEASGDDGWIANLNFTHPLTSQGVFGAFFDAGGVTVDHAPLAGGSGPNRYTLASAGVSLDWRVTPFAVLDLTVAEPVGANLAAQPGGANSDGSRRATRVWVGLNAAF